MKKKIALLYICVLMTSCFDLDLNPLSEGSSENWYSTETELTMAVRFMYANKYWAFDSDSFTDDWTARNVLSEMTNGALNGQSGTVANLWSYSYEAIARANNLLENLDKARKAGISEKFLARIEGESKFVRAAQYSRLVSHFGDVVYPNGSITNLEEAFKMGRTDKKIVMQGVYNDFDEAAELLEINPSGEQRATKGMAYAFKARAALYNKDYEIAAKAAQKCMELGVYKLHPDFANLFYGSTDSSTEFIYISPRSVELNFFFGVRSYVTRNTGGFAEFTPSWDLFCAYLCNDGKPIDESKRYNPQKPFENRDPRCVATIVEFNTNFLGFEYDPNPYATTVMNYSTGKKVKNQDTRSVGQYASYNGLVWGKGVDATWIQNSYKTDKNDIIMRYADVLLMYAEAKIELNDIDQSVLDAINEVRARAYKVKPTQINAYPAITATDQSELRKIVRIERRMEFAFEGLRYMDIIRWGLAEKVLNTVIYGMLDPDDLKAKVVDKGLWFFPGTPDIDEDGVADFSKMHEDGLIKALIQRKFDANRQYLWPIPTKEILINANLNQNPGY